MHTGDDYMKGILKFSTPDEPEAAVALIRVYHDYPSAEERLIVRYWI